MTTTTPNPDQSSKKSASKHPRALLAGGAALVLATGVVLVAKNGSGSGGDAAPPKAAPAAAPSAGPSNTLALSPAALAKNPIATVAAERVQLAADLDLVGSATYDGDRYAVVGPLVPGRVVSIRVRPGETVKAGQVLAEIESAEVGQAQAAYLGKVARSQVAKANLAREKQLAEQHISSERERELAEADATSNAAELRAAEQRLFALGFVPEDVRALDGSARRAGRVALRTPIAGQVTKRSITLGQAVEAATDAFHVADLGKLWVNLDVYEKDLTNVHVGQQAIVRTESHPGETFPSRVAWIEPRIDPDTRTARVRIEFENRDSKLRPGEFVTAHLAAEARKETPPVITVPRRAVAMVEGKPLVFVEEAPGRYVRRPVDLGRTGGDLVEVRAGVSEGDKVVADGAFLLKSESQR